MHGAGVGNRLGVCVVCIVAELHLGRVYEEFDSTVDSYTDLALGEEEGLSPTRHREESSYQQTRLARELGWRVCLSLGAFV